MLRNVHEPEELLILSAMNVSCPTRSQMWLEQSVSTQLLWNRMFVIFTQHSAIGLYYEPVQSKTSVFEVTKRLQASVQFLRPVPEFTAHLVL
jgi:hypothetical protein